MIGQDLCLVFTGGCIRVGPHTNDFSAFYAVLSVVFFSVFFRSVS